MYLDMLDWDWYPFWWALDQPTYATSRGSHGSSFYFPRNPFLTPGHRCISWRLPGMLLKIRWCFPWSGSRPKFSLDILIFVQLNQLNLLLGWFCCGEGSVVGWLGAGGWKICLQFMLWMLVRIIVAVKWHMMISPAPGVYHMVDHPGVHPQTCVNSDLGIIVEYL